MVLPLSHDGLNIRPLSHDNHFNQTDQSDHRPTHSVFFTFKFSLSVLLFFFTFKFSLSVLLFCCSSLPFLFCCSLTFILRMSVSFFLFLFISSLFFPSIRSTLWDDFTNVQTGLSTLDQVISVAALSEESFITEILDPFLNADMAKKNLLIGRLQQALLILIRHPDWLSIQAERMEKPSNTLEDSQEEIDGTQQHVQPMHSLLVKHFDRLSHFLNTLLSMESSAENDQFIAFHGRTFIIRVLFGDFPVVSVHEMITLFGIREFISNGQSTVSVPASKEEEEQEEEPTIYRGNGTASMTQESPTNQQSPGTAMTQESDITGLTTQQSPITEQLSVTQQSMNDESLDPSCVPSTISSLSQHKNIQLKKSMNSFNSITSTTTSINTIISSSSHSPLNIPYHTEPELSFSILCQRYRIQDTDKLALDCSDFLASSLCSADVMALKVIEKVRPLLRLSSWDCVAIKTLEYLLTHTAEWYQVQHEQRVQQHGTQPYHQHEQQVHVYQQLQNNVVFDFIRSVLLSRNGRIKDLTIFIVIEQSQLLQLLYECLIDLKKQSESECTAQDALDTSADFSSSKNNTIPSSSSEYTAERRQSITAVERQSITVAAIERQSITAVETGRMKQTF